MEKIVFDTTSGISLEEQKEILAGIDAMAVGSRVVSKAPETNAKKKGYLFPLAVNLCALVIFGFGFLLLTIFHGHGEQQIRQTTAVLGLTERMLIQEIRLETNLLISEKENLINDILAMLLAVDAEYRILSESVETLTEAQSERAAYLLSVQHEYQQTLISLQDERASILEDARLREANLRIQAEERARELTLRIEQSEVGLSDAMEELRRLGTEQERLNRAESQMSGFFAAVNSHLSSGNLLEASASLRAMRDFLDAPSIQGLRAFEVRRESHLQTIAFMENVVAASAGVGQIGTGELSELAALNAALAQRNENLERDIAAFSSLDSDHTRVIAEYMAMVRELELIREDQEEAHRAEIAQRETQWESERDSFMAEVVQRELEVAALNQNLTAVNTTNEEIRRQNEELHIQIEAIRTLLQN